MTIVAIEVSDAGLVGATARGLIGPPSPGYAVFDGRELLVGPEAFAAARLRPRWANNRFWDLLDTEPLPRPFPRRLSHADFVHAHLSRLWSDLQPELTKGERAVGVLLAVPGALSGPQLGLLLGVARACEVPVTGMVDAAVAAVEGTGSRRVLHLDLSLHRVIWTELVQGTEIARRRVEVSERAGLASIWDAWARTISGLFVRRTRFDPLHDGNTEQALYCRLPEWLEEVTRRGSTRLKMESGGTEHAVELEATQLMAAAGAQLDHVFELGRALVDAGEPATILLSSRAAGLPGISERLSRIAEGEVGVLPPGAAALGALARRAEIESPGSELPLVTRLRFDESRVDERRQTSASGAQPTRGSSHETPTHLLHDGIAYPVSEHPFWLGVAIPADCAGVDLTGAVAGISRAHCSLYRRDDRVLVDDHSSYGTYLNGRRIRGRAELKVGDRLRLGTPGIELRLIRVADLDV